MKNILHVPIRSTTVKLPPVKPSVNFNPPTDLTSEELLDVINQGEFELTQSIKDKAELASRTVYLSLNHGIEYTEEGPMYLGFLPPWFEDFLNNAVIFEDYNEFHPGTFGLARLSGGGTLWVLLPIGKRYTIVVSVQSKRKNTFFHIGVRYKDYSEEYTVKSLENGQLLTFNVDTTQSVFYGIDIRNMKNEKKNAKIAREWTFFKCAIVRLD